MIQSLLNTLTGSGGERDGGWPATENVLLSLTMLLLAAGLPPYPASPGIVLVMTLASWLHFRAQKIGWRRWWEQFWQVTIIPGAFAVIGALAVGMRFTPVVGFTEPDLKLAIGILLRSLAGTVTIGYLVLSVTIGEMILILRRGGLPTVLGDLLISTFRFVLILIKTSHNLIRAQLVRGGYDSPDTARRSMALLMMALLVLTVERARRLEIGIAARTGDGEWKILAPQTKISPFRLLVIGAAALVIILVSSWSGTAASLAGGIR